MQQINVKFNTELPAMFSTDPLAIAQWFEYLRTKGSLIGRDKATKGDSWLLEKALGDEAAQALRAIVFCLEVIAERVAQGRALVVKDWLIEYGAPTNWTKQTWDWWWDLTQQTGKTMLVQEELPVLLNYSDPRSPTVSVAWDFPGTYQTSLDVLQHTFLGSEEDDQPDAESQAILDILKDGEPALLAMLTDHNGILPIQVGLELSMEENRLAEALLTVKGFQSDYAYWGHFTFAYNLASKEYFTEGQWNSDQLH